jgi:uncharacterized protein (TIGR00730 family)
MTKPSLEASAQINSPSYLLPIEDTRFLLRDEMRAVRFALEYAKADLLLRDWGVRSTIIVFGSARVPSPERVESWKQAATAPGEKELQRMERQLRWYQTAREFGRIASERGGAKTIKDGWRDNVIATGGGPGIMEAANRGAHEAGAPTIGFNIRLPHEQLPNRYTTPELTFRFHYFAMRKMHLVMRANALVIFPGGFGTMDELFELLTLRQTGKAHAMPIVMFDRSYWQRLLNFDVLLEESLISPDDMELICYADSAEEIWQLLVERGLRIP